MDFDPRIPSDGVGDNIACGHCNFHFGYVYDVFDEDAKNEETCVQALKYLIAKEDTDISDLEDELAILQCQHKWGEVDEHKNPYEICRGAFEQRIVSLTSSIENLINGDLSHGHGEFTSLEIERPAERICDIINALIKSNFTELDAQVGDLDSENNRHVSESPDIDRDLGEQATTTETVSGESTSEAATCVNKYLREVKGMVASNVELSAVSEKAGSASERKSGLLASMETLISQSPYQASNDEAHSKATALLNGHSKNCMQVSKTGGNGLTFPEAIVIEEQDGRHTRSDSGGSLSAAFSELKDPFEDYTTPANQIQSATYLKIAQARQKSNLSSILKTTGEEVHKKILNDAWPMPERQRKSKKRKSPSVQDIGQSPSPSSEDGRSSCLLEENSRRKLITEQDVVCGNPQVLEAKSSHTKGACKKLFSNPSPEVKVPKAVQGTKKSLASNAWGRHVSGLESRDSIELKSSGSTSDNPITIGNNTSTLVIQKTTELPSIHLESLRQNLLEDPGYFKKLTVLKLREIMRCCKLPRVTKLKKEELIQTLTDFLTGNSVIQLVSADTITRAQHLETKDQLVSADPPSRKDNVETNDQLVSADLALSKDNVETIDQLVSVDSTSRKENLDQKDQHVPAGSAFSLLDVETKHHQVSVNSYRTQDQEIKHHHGSADSTLRSQDLEREDQQVSTDSVCRTQDLEREDQHVSADSSCRTQDLERKDLHVFVESASRTRDLEQKDQQVSAESVPSTQDLETKEPAEGQLAVGNQSHSGSDMCHEEVLTA